MTVMGVQAAYGISSNSQKSVVIGDYAGKNKYLYVCVIIGSDACNSSDTHIYGGVSIGQNSKIANTENVAIGDYAIATTGSRSTVLGARGVSNGNRQVLLGYGVNSNTGSDNLDYGIYTSPSTPAISGSWNYLGFNSSSGRIGFVSSSRRFKKEIIYEKDICYDILKLKTVSYEDKNCNFCIRHIGYIGEDLVELKNKTIDLLIPKDNKGLVKGVYYDRIVPLLIPIVKEHKEKITILENDNFKLNEKVLKLEDKLTKLLNILNIDYI
jgi:hypothetical protein